MPLELINAIAAFGTLVLLAATTLAAFVQLRHMRAANELAALLAIERDFRLPDVQHALRVVQSELHARLDDPAYRAELGNVGYIDPRRHPEMVLCNWFNRTGTLVRGGFVNEALFLDSFGRLAIYYWDLLVPAIAVLRRTRGPGQYAAFEYLVCRAAARDRRRRADPGSEQRRSVDDPRLDEDARRA